MCNKITFFACENIYDFFICLLVIFLVINTKYLTKLCCMQNISFHLFHTWVFSYFKTKENSNVRINAHIRVWSYFWICRKTHHFLSRTFLVCRRRNKYPRWHHPKDKTWNQGHVKRMPFMKRKFSSQHSRLCHLHRMKQNFLKNMSRIDSLMDLIFFVQKTFTCSQFLFSNFDARQLSISDYDNVYMIIHWYQSIIL